MIEEEKNIQPVSSTQKQNSPHPLIYLGIVMGIIIIILLVGVAYLLGQKNTEQKENNHNPVISPEIIKSQSANNPTNQTITISPTPTIELTSSIKETGVTNQKRYTNPKVGISFVFSTKFSGETMDIKEMGDKIYLYDTKYPYTQGQYIEYFQKNSTDNLSQAIQKQFLTNISTKDCFVKDSKPDSHAKYPATFEIKILSYPINENSDVPAFAQINNCPTPYAESNGIAYFLGDSAHPKIFLFFSIGQQEFPIDPQTNTPWQDTIEFLD